FSKEYLLVRQRVYDFEVVFPVRTRLPQRFSPDCYPVSSSVCTRTAKACLLALSLMVAAIPASSQGRVQAPAGQEPDRTVGVRNAQATTDPPYSYYVDGTAGSDANPGTQALPWKTLAKVGAATLRPGQAVGLRRGQVWRESLILRNSGTVTAPILL